MASGSLNTIPIASVEKALSHATQFVTFTYATLVSPDDLARVVSEIEATPENERDSLSAVLVLVPRVARLLEAGWRVFADSSNIVTAFAGNGEPILAYRHSALAAWLQQCDTNVVQPILEPKSELYRSLTTRRVDMAKFPKALQFSYTYEGMVQITFHLLQFLAALDECGSPAVQQFYERYPADRQAEATSMINQIHAAQPGVQVTPTPCVVQKTVESAAVTGNVRAYNGSADATAFPDRFYRRMNTFKNIDKLLKEYVQAGHAGTAASVPRDTWVRLLVDNTRIYNCDVASEFCIRKTQQCYDEIAAAQLGVLGRFKQTFFPTPPSQTNQPPGTQLVQLRAGVNPGLPQRLGADDNDSSVLLCYNNATAAGFFTMFRGTTSARWATGPNKASLEAALKTSPLVVWSMTGLPIRIYDDTAAPTATVNDTVAVLASAAVTSCPRMTFAVDASTLAVDRNNVYHVASAGSVCTWMAVDLVWVPAAIATAVVAACHGIEPAWQTASSSVQALRFGGRIQAASTESYAFRQVNKQSTGVGVYLSETVAAVSGGDRVQWFRCVPTIDPGTATWNDQLALFDTIPLANGTNANTGMWIVCFPVAFRKNMTISIPAAAGTGGRPTLVGPLVVPNNTRMEDFGVGLRALWAPGTTQPRQAEIAQVDKRAVTGKPAAPLGVTRTFNCDQQDLQFQYVAPPSLASTDTFDARLLFHLGSYLAREEIMPGNYPVVHIRAIDDPLEADPGDDGDASTPAFTPFPTKENCATYETTRLARQQLLAQQQQQQQQQQLRLQQQQQQRQRTPVSYPSVATSSLGYRQPMPTSHYYPPSAYGYPQQQQQRR